MRMCDEYPIKMSISLLFLFLAFLYFLVWDSYHICVLQPFKRTHRQYLIPVSTWTSAHIEQNFLTFFGRFIWNILTVRLTSERILINFNRFSYFIMIELTEDLNFSPELTYRNVPFEYSINLKVPTEWISKTHVCLHSSLCSSQCHSLYKLYSLNIHHHPRCGCHILWSENVLKIIYAIFRTFLIYITQKHELLQQKCDVHKLCNFVHNI